MTEDDTYRRLIRRPLDEVCRWLLSMSQEDRDIMSTEKGKEAFSLKFGWTIDEVNVEWLKTNSHAWRFPKPKRR